MLHDGVLDGALGAEGDAHRDELVHLLRPLVDLLVLVRAGEMLRAVEVQHHLRHGTDSVGVAAHHHVREPHEVVERDVARGHAHVHRHLVSDARAEVEVLDSLERRGVVPARCVHTAHAHEGEVAEDILDVCDAHLRLQHAVQPRCFRLQLVVAQDGVDLRLDNHLVQALQHLHRVPHLRLVCKHLELEGGALLEVLRAVAAEVLELVHELVHHVPQPLHRQVNALHVILVGEDAIKQDGVVLPRLHPLLQRERVAQLRVQVPEVQLLVQHQEHVILDERVDLVGVRPGLRLEVAVGDLAKLDLVTCLNIIELLLTQLGVRLEACGVLHIHVPVHKLLELAQEVFDDRHALRLHVVAMLLLRHVEVASHVLLTRQILRSSDIGSIETVVVEVHC
mmetsp:Transcript_52083/g.106214  ORF Transcript_52083/g.106214 Transcript_52083/m.106214 type:complete len:394 (+) Transcript_52083:661-1842(+)